MVPAQVDGVQLDGGRLVDGWWMRTIAEGRYFVSAANNKVDVAFIPNDASVRVVWVARGESR